MYNPHKLFVGGLPATLSQQELQMAFNAIDPLVRVDLKCRKDNPALNLGYAFLLVDDAASAKRLISRHYNIGNRTVQVQQSRLPGESNQNNPQNSCRLYLRGIPKNATDEQLKQYFDEFSACRAAYAISDISGHSRGFGYIETETSEAAQILLQIKTFKFGDSHMIVESFRRQEPTTRKERREANRRKGSKAIQTDCNKLSKKLIKDTNNQPQQHLAAHERQLYEESSDVTGSSRRKLWRTSTTVSHQKEHHSRKHIKEPEPHSGGYGNYEPGFSFDYESLTGDTFIQNLHGSTLIGKGQNTSLQLPTRGCSEAEITSIAQRLNHGNTNVRFNVLLTRSKTKESQDTI